MRESRTGVAETAELFDKLGSSAELAHTSAEAAKWTPRVQRQRAVKLTSSLCIKPLQLHRALCKYARPHPTDSERVTQLLPDIRADAAEKVEVGRRL